MNEVDFFAEIMSKLNLRNNGQKSIKESILGLEKEIENVKVQQAKASERLLKFDLKVDNTFQKSIDLVIEGHMDIVEKLKRVESAVNKNENLRSRVAALEHIVESHSKKLEAV